MRAGQPRGASEDGSGKAGRRFGPLLVVGQGHIEECVIGGFLSGFGSGFALPAVQQDFLRRDVAIDRGRRATDAESAKYETETAKPKIVIKIQ